MPLPAALDTPARLRAAAPCPIASRRDRGWRVLATVGLLAGGAWGCDGTTRGLDAAAAPSAHMSTLSLRIDVTAEKPPTLTVLGFRAAFSGVSASDVMALVDPLADTGPGRDCALRDIGSAASALGTSDDGVELEELGGVGIAVGDAPPNIRLSPRLFPDVTPAIGGVVSEAGPFMLAGDWPAHFNVTTDVTAETASAQLTVPVPSAGQITAVNGLVPSPHGTTAIDGDLKLDLIAGGAGDSAVEVRPLGATAALICRVPADATRSSAISFVVSHQLLSSLIATTGAAQGRPVAASLDLVRRINGNYASSDSRIVVEVRASTLLELHP